MERLKNVFNAITNTSTPAPTNRLYFKDSSESETHSIHLYQANDCFYFQSQQLSKLKAASSKGLKYYDASLGNTICASSQICFIDGDKSILTYRGYPIEQLAQKSTYLQVAFLLIYGDLPGKAQLSRFTQNIMENSLLPTDISLLVKSFRYDAHPMGILVSSIAALSAQKSVLTQIQDLNKPQSRNNGIFILLGCLPTLAASSYRHRIGRAVNPPNKELGYIENFLYMLDRLNQKNYSSHPKIVRAFETLFILHAEHEVNCSTALLRHLISADANIFSAVSAAAGALYGPRHGGANASVIQMLQQIGSIGNINKFMLQVKQKKRILYGFGHRVYKNHDPRAQIAKKVALDVFSVCGKEPLIEVALQIQRIAALDEFFVTRRIYPNIDFYNGLIYRAMGIPTDMYPLLFALPLLAGWLAHWIQSLKNKVDIFSPSQFYNGKGTRQFIQLSQRKDNGIDLDSLTNKTNKRRAAHKEQQQK